MSKRETKPENVQRYAATRREAVKGLLRKLRTNARAERELVAVRLCRSMGFCDAGIQEFCELNEMDKSRTQAAVAELRAAIKPRLRENRARFGHDLRRLGVLQ